MKEAICEQFERINDIISKYEDAVSVYYDLLDMIEIGSENIIALLDQFVPYIFSNERLSQNDIDSIKDWLNDKLDEMSRIADIK